MLKRTFRLIIFCGLSISLFSLQAQESQEISAQRALLDSALSKHIDSPKLIGSATFKVAFWKIYNIALYADASNSEPYNGTAPYALEIEYLRDFSGEAMADKSVELIADQGFEDEYMLEIWQEKMIEIFPDIDKGTVLTGIYTKENTSVFYGDGQYLGVLDDPDFCEYFFDIWLGEDTSQPDLRAELIPSS